MAKKPKEKEDYRPKGGVYVHRPINLYYLRRGKPSSNSGGSTITQSA